MKKLLVDADILVYNSGFHKIDSFGESFEDPKTSRLPDLGEAKVSFLGRLDGIQEDIFRLFPEEEDLEVVLCISNGPSFRKRLCPSYKAHRVAPPEIIHQLKQWLITEMDALWGLDLEADDIMGMSQKADGSTIICTEDKDLKQIPGLNYNWKTKVLLDISERDALLHFYAQAIAGDPTDGFKGVEHIGYDTAQRIVSSVKNPLMLWDIVASTFETCGSTEEAALLCARMAYILHPKDAPDYLWKPPMRRGWQGDMTWDNLKDFDQVWRDWKKHQG